VDLRYGINPHQAVRAAESAGPSPLALRAGSPSYINVLDALNAWQLVREAAAATGLPVATSFKHVSPAGAATSGPLDDAARATWGIDGSVGALTSAYLRARDGDPKSSFGDVIAVSQPVDLELAQLLARVISDGIVAPGFEPGAMAILARKKGGSFLVLEADPDVQPPDWERRDVLGMVLEQQRDAAPITAELLGAAADSLTQPAVDALLGLVAARYTQSNSVVLVRDGQALGIGAGQQNRVDCVRLAAAKAATWWLRRHPTVRAVRAADGMTRQDLLNWQVRLADSDMTELQEAEFRVLFPGIEPALAPADRSAWLAGLTDLTLVSDGFLPFRDNVDHAARIGVRHIVEPGGSTRSDEVAQACAELGITLTRTGLRLFHH
jgi:phosphoribosylaminoimidazolecarboxamide formyltransferase/IMP cyclohydrolase